VSRAQPGWVRRLSGYVLRHRRDVVISLGAAVLGSACQVVVPLVEREIVDGSIVSQTSPLLPWLVGLLVLAAATFGFAYLRRYYGGRVALTVQYDLRNEMHAHLQGMDFANLDRMPTGQLVARANSDSALVQGLLSFLPIMTGNVLMMLMSLVVMLYLSPLLALVTLVVVPALLVVSYRMRQRIFPATWDAQQREGDVAQIVDEDVNGVRVVKAFGQERRELERVSDAAGMLYGAQMRSVRLQARYQPMLQAIPTLLPERLDHPNSVDILVDDLRDVALALLTVPRRRKQAAAHPVGHREQCGNHDEREQREQRRQHEHHRERQEHHEHVAGHHR